MIVQQNDAVLSANVRAVFSVTSCDAESASVVLLTADIVIVNEILLAVPRLVVLRGVDFAHLSVDFTDANRERMWSLMADCVGVIRVNSQFWTALFWFCSLFTRFASGMPFSA